MNSLSFKYGFLPITIAVGAASLSLAGETKTLRLDAGELRSMRFETSSGFLNVTGVEGDQIEVIAEIVADSNDYQLSLDKSGDRALLVCTVKPRTSLSATQQRINLNVKVPGRLRLDIKDESGDIGVQNAGANVKIDDGSGAIVVKGTVGDLDIRDGSGDIDVSDVNGKLAIEDSSGAIAVANVRGDVDIRDGSGAIGVAKVDGHVMIRDGSGGIAVSHVKRGLTIRGGAAGELRTSQIEGGIDRQR